MPAPGSNVSAYALALLLLLAAGWYLANISPLLWRLWLVW